MCTNDLVILDNNTFHEAIIRHYSLIVETICFCHLQYIDMVPEVLKLVIMITAQSYQNYIDTIMLL